MSLRPQERPQVTTPYDQFCKEHEQAVAEFHQRNWTHFKDDPLYATYQCLQEHRRCQPEYNLFTRQLNDICKFPGPYKAPLAEEHIFAAQAKSDYVLAVIKH